MQFAWWVRWYVGVWFQDWCPDPGCNGQFVMSDDRPDRDYCTHCRRNRGDFEGGKQRVRVRSR